MEKATDTSPVNNTRTENEENKTEKRKPPPPRKNKSSSSLSTDSDDVTSGSKVTVRPTSKASETRELHSISEVNSTVLETEADTTHEDEKEVSVPPTSKRDIRRSAKPRRSSSSGSVTTQDCSTSSSGGSSAPSSAIAGSPSTGSTFSTVSGPSPSSRSSTYKTTAPLRRTSTLGQFQQNSVPVGDANSRLLKMALKREWSQLELTLRYMARSDPGLFVVDDETGLNPLMLAARDNRLVVVERLIEMGVNINDRARDGQAAIHFAVTNGREEVVHLLIKKRAELNVKGGEKQQLPLHMASSRTGNNSSSIAQAVVRATSKNLRLVPDKDGNIALFNAINENNQAAYRELLSVFSEEQLRYQHPGSGNTVLHLACERRDAEMVKLFCKKGSLVNVQNKEGITALHIAASMGDIPIIECLYAHKADPGLLDHMERTPLHTAAEKGHTSVVELLADRFPKAVLRRTKDGSTLMHIASECGHPETALAFLKKGVPLHMPNKSGAVCLHSAAKNNHVEVVRTLLMKGAHVDAKTKNKLTALHVAVQHCRPLVVQMLLGFGAPVQMKGGSKRETPLHLAAQIPDGEQVSEMLIKSGADVNCEREDGETAVHMAARGGNLNTFKLLLEEGGDLRTQSKSCENALHIAVRHCRWDIISHMLEFLEAKYSRYEATMCVNMENREGETPMHLAAELTRERAHVDGEELKIVHLLLTYGGDVNFCTKLTHETPLHYCARSGNEHSLRILLEHIGKYPDKMPSIINRQAKNGWSPLLFASDEGHQASVDILLQHSARVDVFDENGKAALHLAAENAHDVIADMLIRKKAFINAKTKLGLTPLHLAAQRGYNDLVKKLLSPIGSEQKASIDALSLDKKTPLHKAAEDGKIDVCQTLLNAGADVLATDSHGQTPLHLAAENDHSNVVGMFLAHRGNLVEIENKNGSTCAHIAASKGSVAVIKELLNSNRESVTTTANKITRSTALHLAASKGHAEVVRELILHGANPMDEDMEGMNALHLSAKFGHSSIIEVILSNQKAIESKMNASLRSLWQKTSSKTGFNALHVATQSGKEEFAREMLLRIPAAEPSQLPGIKLDNLHPTQTDHAFTPLHLASQSGHVNLVRMILNYPGVSVDAVTAKQKVTPLHLAAKSGYVAVVGLLLSKSIKQLGCKDDKGYTCLHYAAACGHLDMASLLLGQGADIHTSDKMGMTPLHLAAKSGSLKMVKLLKQAGASTSEETKHDRRTPIQFAASGRHYDVVSYLLKSEHDTHKLMEDKSFVCDMMLVAKSPSSHKDRPMSSYSGGRSLPDLSKNMDILEEFVLASSAPIEVAAKLSRAFMTSSNREKEQAKGLVECSDYCQNLAVDLLEVCSAANGANDILKATDNKSTPFLDVLIECEQKNVIAHPAVQKYLSDVWVGNLDWSDRKLILLFAAILFIPFLWFGLSLPLNLKLNRIPIVKFMVNLVSHFYLVTLFVITVAIPITPIYEQDDLIPQWNEWLLLVWVTGVLVNEITSPGRSTGISRIRTIVLVLCALAIVIHLVGFAYPYFGPNSPPESVKQRQEVIYVRNICLSAAMTFAFVQFLEFLSFHYLFGPWSKIIGGLLNDLFKFGVIVLMFIIAFTMWLAAVYQPVYQIPSNTTTEIVGGGNGAGGARVLNALDTFQILFFALFGLIEPDNLPPINQSPVFSIYIVQIVFGLYHVITLIVLINLLIAMMSDTYQRIQAQSDTEWKFGRAELIRYIKKTSLSPSPTNLLITAYTYSKLFIKHKGRACDVGLAPSEVDDAPVNTKDNVYLDTQHTHTLTNDKKSLTDVVDWDAIRHKYWERKGKIKQTGNDIIAALGRATSYTERGGQDRPNLNGGIHRNDMNSNLPHTVVYDNEAFDAHK